MRSLVLTAAMVSLSGLMTACGSADTSSTGEAQSAESSAVCVNHNWLALGDSIAFGYDPTVANPNVASNFIGYPDVVAEEAHKADTNAACPGETSASFIDTSKPDNGCQGWRNYYKFPLHTSYTGSQLSYAVAYIQANHPKYITFNLGANDLLLLQNSCTTDAGPSVACLEGGLPGVLQAYGQNLGQIFTAIKGAGFDGQLVAMTTYATDYNNPLDVLALTDLNNVLAQVAGQFGFTVADGYGAFKAAATTLGGGDPCKAGLLIPFPAGQTATCNIHPNKAGREILEDAVMAVSKVK